MAKKNNSKKNKKDKIDESKLFQQVLKKNISWLLVSMFNKYSDSKVTAMELTLNKLFERYKNFNARDYTKDRQLDDYIVTIFLNYLYEIIYYSKNNKEHGVAIKGMGVEKILKRMYEDVKIKNISLLDFSGIMGFRNYFCSSTKERELYDTLQIELICNVNFEEYRRDIYVDMIRAIEFMSTYLFLIMVKPKNYIIKEFVFKNEETMIIDYSPKKFISDTDINYYKTKGNYSINSLALRLVDKNGELWYRTYMLSPCHIYEGYLKFLNKKGENLQSYSVNTGIVFPFIDIYCEISENLKVDVGGEVTVKKDLFKELKDKKKYAMPSDGCIVRFLSNDVSFEYMYIKDCGNKYLLEINAKENVFEGSYEDTNKVILYYEKKYIEEVILKLGTNDNINMLECFSEYSYGALGTQSMNNIRSNEGIRFIISINILFFILLHAIYVGLDNAELTIQNVEINKDGSYRIKNDVYRTAYIRRLPKNSRRSEEANARAIKEGIILPPEYTFVREYVPESEKAIKTIKL